MRRGAYVKPLLHAAKYPHSAVNGVLLAKNQQNRDDKHLELVDAIPLFHSSLTLAPMMEVALSMVSGALLTSAPTAPTTTSVVPVKLRSMRDVHGGGVHARLEIRPLRPPIYCFYSNTDRGGAILPHQSPIQ